jgi:L-lactate dehydrogenase complex protein LldG
MSVDIDRFCQMLTDYRALVHRCHAHEAPSIIGRLSESKRLVTPQDFPSEFIPEAAAVVRDAYLSTRELDQIDTALTLCAVGIEETGTIVLDAGPGQGRRAISLIPDHHICIVRADQVVHSVAEAVAKLNESARAGDPLTWISGPSATSDIELVRVEGVHGPRKLEVIVVE